MSTILPNTGPLGNERLDSLRTAALVAVDDGLGVLPDSVIDYIQSLEAGLLTAQDDARRRALDQLWAARRETRG